MQCYSVTYFWVGIEIMYHQLPEVMLTEMLNYLNPTVPTLKVGVAQEQVSSCGWSLQVGAHFHYEAKGANFWCRL